VFEASPGTVPPLRTRTVIFRLRQRVPLLLLALRVPEELRVDRCRLANVGMEEVLHLLVDRRPRGRAFHVGAAGR
jgi:hypothetical protein